MTLMVWLLLALLLAEAVGTGAFTYLYYRWSDWRSSLIGRHLLAYGCAFSALYLATFLVMVWPQPLTMGVLLAAHLAFTSAVWHRVVLVVQAQHQTDLEADDG